MASKPANERPCARCVRDTTPGCTHLDYMYTQAKLKGLDDNDLIAYALNRMWALERDNKNKEAGNKASRIYKSRNLTTNAALANKCGFQKGQLRCIRNAGHEPADAHKF